MALLMYDHAYQKIGARFVGAAERLLFGLTYIEI